jgi:NADP-dependent 3-hydroxy acid dehydrogenase YdfG
MSMKSKKDPTGGKRPKEDRGVETSLLGKRVIVTGGTTGIGRAVAHQLVGKGARVFIFGRHGPELRDALREAPKGPGSIEGCVADQSKHSQIRKLFARADACLGGLDILVNNAAVGSDDLLEDSDAEAAYIVSCNVTGYIWCAREALGRMLPRGVGHIINIGSMSAEKRGEGSEVYTTTKSANRGLSDALRRTHGPDNIRVTLIEPGKTGTDLLEVPVSQQRAAETKMTMLTAEEVADCVIYCLTRPPRVSIARVQIVPVAHQS